MDSDNPWLQIEAQVDPVAENPEGSAPKLKYDYKESKKNYDNQFLICLQGAPLSIPRVR